jgi:hypothetical protein
MMGVVRKGMEARELIQKVVRQQPSVWAMKTNGYRG